MIDAIFLTLSKELHSSTPKMAVFFTGTDLPLYCEAMPRSPAPKIGQRYDEAIFDVIRSAVALNPAIHDGAMLVGRKAKHADYHIAGWSYRLFPPASGRENIGNRGSAFYSSAAMSLVRSIDKVYSIGHGETFVFINGQAKLLG